MSHIPQIKKALGVERIHTEYYSWRSKESETPAQIDLIIDRADQITNICEIKYSRADYSISAEEERRLQNRVNDFDQETRTRNATHLTLITTFGLKENSHSSGISSIVLMDDLFA